MNQNGNIMNKKEAENYLYELWQNGELPSNFTEDHSSYNDALKYVMCYDYFCVECI